MAESVKMGKRLQFVAFHVPDLQQFIGPQASLHHLGVEVLPASVAEGNEPPVAVPGIYFEGE